MAASKSWVSLVLISAMPDCYHSDLCYDYLLRPAPACQHVSMQTPVYTAVPET